MQNLDARISELRSKITANIAELEVELAAQRQKLAALDEVQSIVVDKLSDIEGGDAAPGTDSGTTSEATENTAPVTAPTKPAPVNTATARTAAKKSASGVKTARKKAPTTRSAANDGKPGLSDAIREALRKNRGPMTVNDLIAAVDGKTRSTSTDMGKAVSATLSNLLRSGDIKRVAVGQYSI